MIVGSLLFIAGAAVMLVVGVWQSSSVLLSGSIAASLLAAIGLVVAVRRGARTPAPPGPADGAGEPVPEEVEPSGGAPTIAIPVQGAPPAQAAPEGGSRPYQDGPPAYESGRYEPEQYEDEQYDEDVDPPDEPAPQQVSASDSARVGRMMTEVLVVDGRPRYHLPGCVHLLGRESEPLPVSEALELGFTPCSLCEPDSALLADARRV